MPTKLIRSTYNLTTHQQGAVLTIGNFDGVHLGHQNLIAEVIAKAKEKNKPSLVMTFEPHPFEFFEKDKIAIPRLTRLREKFSALAKTGIDNVLIIPFKENIATKSASQFVTEILYDKLHPTHIVVGDDFRFGRYRQGNVDLLSNMGKSLGFSVEDIPSVLLQGERVSSTKVRQALAAGQHALANKLLGRPYSMMGRIRLGDQLGRQWGVPTANIFLHRRSTPVQGVFTVYMHGIADQPWPGVANVGIRPTVDGTRTLLEVHLLDFNKDIYGCYVEVEFCEKLREEIRYPNIELLKEQIAKDIIVARNYFRQQGTL